MAKKAKSWASKTINYRRCLFGADVGQTLQQLLNQALGKFSTVGDRLEPLNKEGTEFRLIGNHQTLRSCLCGYLSSFKRGAKQPVIVDDATAQRLSLSAVSPPPPKNGEAKKEFVPGVIYFAVIGNHVAFVATHALRVNMLELHLHWLLKNKASVLDAAIPFALSNEAEKATREKIKKSQVKSIAFGQPLMEVVEETDSTLTPLVASSKGTRTVQATKSVFFRPIKAVWDMIKPALPNDAFEKLGLDGVFSDDLEVWIEIKYPKRTRARSEDTAELMNKIGIAVRDMEDANVLLQLANGHKVSGQELRISGTIEAQLAADGRIDEQVLFDQMVTWLSKQLSDGVIDP